VIKKALSVAASIMLALAVMLGLTGTPAHAEPAGQYSYICIGTDGSGHTFTAAYYRCNGWLDKYINGNKIAHVDERRNYAKYQAGIPGNVLSVECAVALVVTLIAPPVGWVATPAGLIGLGFACRNG
jgi:hypothetical protein